MLSIISEYINGILTNYAYVLVFDGRSDSYFVTLSSD